MKEKREGFADGRLGGQTSADEGEREEGRESCLARVQQRKGFSTCSCQSLDLLPRLIAQSKSTSSASPSPSLHLLPTYPFSYRLHARSSTDSHHRRHKTWDPVVERLTLPRPAISLPSFCFCFFCFCFFFFSQLGNGLCREGGSVHSSPGRTRPAQKTARFVCTGLLLLVRVPVPSLAHLQRIVSVQYYTILSFFLLFPRPIALLRQRFSFALATTRFTLPPNGREENKSLDYTPY